MLAIDIFKSVSADTRSYAIEWKKKTGKKVIGYFCSYAPEEIIHASGALPYRIFGSGENISLADSYLQSYSCSLVRGGLEDALNGSLSFLDGTAFPHTCDSIQRLSDVWRMNAGFKLHFDIVLPVKLNTESAKEYMAEVIEKFRRDYSQALGITTTDDDLKKSIAHYNKIRSSMMELYGLRSNNPGIITGSDMYAVIKSAMVMDRNDFLDNLTKLLSELKTSGRKESKPRKRIILAGGICNHPDFYTFLEDAGGAVVWDELCTGTRLFEGIIDTNKAPVAAISERYLERIVCPAKHSSLTDRGENLAEIVKDKKAQGVIFIYLKFCDPQSFDYPYMKGYLEKAGVPYMLLEVEERLPSEGQLRTRFETFVEML
jgi:bzd-type benzoyl-CoA reductase N subunit